MNRNDLDDMELDALLSLPEPAIADDGFCSRIEDALNRQEQVRTLVPLAGGLTGLALSSLALTGIDLSSLVPDFGSYTGEMKLTMSEIAVLSAMLLGPVISWVVTQER